jgi:hypothetical protein
MEEQVKEVIAKAPLMDAAFREQLERMRDFRDRMKDAGAIHEDEQFAVPAFRPMLPMQSLAR